ncbi:MAG: AAA family ATPase [bacterium]|nr:AAA family ATPase [bacterium]
MRLVRIELVNWRSFPACDIDLSTDITVVIGQNSAGKTALLNAFVWGLYGQTTPGFSKPDDLCNHKAKHDLGVGEATQTEVAVTFLHGTGDAECRYEARRSLKVTRTGPGQADFAEEEPQFVLNCYPTGLAGDARTTRGEAAEREVQAIIPASLNPYFFFPAENIGSSIGASDARAASVKEAVSVLLGLKRFEVADAAIKRALHLPKLKAKTSNDLEIRKAQQREELARDNYEDVDKELSELSGEIQAVGRLKEEAEQAVGRVRSERALIERRSKIQRKYEGAQQAARSAEAQRRQVLSDECFNLFGAKSLSDARDVLDRAKSDDKIPPKVSAGLLDDLIDNAEACICGQSITDHALSTLRELRQGIVDDIVAELASNVRARVSERCEQLSARTDEYAPHAVLRAANKAISDAHRDMATWLGERDEFDADNPSVGEDASSDPFTAWKKWTGQHEQLKSRQKKLEDRKEELSKERREAATQFERLLEKRGKADNISKARGHLARVEEAVEDIQRALSDGSRGDLERAINQIASQVLLRDYTIHLTPNFDIEARQNGIDVGASSSEHAWVTFAFVGAITGLIDAYDRRLDSMGDAGNVSLEPGDGYPLVLDAPFSPFGEDYAKEFAKRLPGLAPQSVLIVREDQLDYLGPILDAGPTKVRAYLMCLYGRTTAEKQEIIWRDGSSRAYVKPSDDTDDVRTVLEELPV